MVKEKQDRLLVIIHGAVHRSASNTRSDLKWGGGEPACPDVRGFERLRMSTPQARGPPGKRNSPISFRICTFEL